MEPVILAVVVGSLTAVKSALRCVEILVRAQADNMRERARRATILAIMAAMQGSRAQIASVGKSEIMGSKPRSDGTPGPARDNGLR
jgi:hypothetical protein